MAKHLKAIFGDKLLADPLERYPVKFRNLILTLSPQLNIIVLLFFKLYPGCKLPSPKDLKYKILVKFSKKIAFSKFNKTYFECFNILIILKYIFV